MTTAPPPAQTASLPVLAGLPPQAVPAALGSTAEGLMPSEAQARLAREGPNLIDGPVRQGPLRRLLGLFAAPLPLLLLTLAAVSWATGESRGALVIAVMVGASTVLAFVQEHRSGQAAERLRHMVRTTAQVRRGGATADVPVEHLVRGDVVLLSAGDIIPADLRLLAAKDLFVNQAALTGEALPLEKHAAAQASAGEGPAASSPSSSAPSALELGNVCFMGTHVVSGSGTGIVAATGPRTEFGAIAASALQDAPPTDFDRGVQRFIRLMLRFMLVMVPLVFVINGLAKGDWMEALLFATAVAVGLTPEMLPMIVTLNLAKGAIGMSRKQVIVKHLSAIQNFGAMDVLCTDKTGTLTQDKVILKRHLDITGADSPAVLEWAYLNSYHQSGLKNLLDVAVLEHAEVHARLDAAQRWRKIDEVPFDFERRRMSVVVEEAGGRHVLICKGAVEEVFRACTRCERAGRIEAIEPGHRDDLLGVVDALNEDGFRVIAVAYKEIPLGQATYSVADESELVLAGYIAFLDPPKESAAPALAALSERGVAVKILTGDNGIVARKICRDVGLDVDRAVLGSELDALSDAELAALLPTQVLFAKLTPAQKARLITALQATGHVVGYMGDGINDSPALKAADVGISVDTGADIAKDSADIILLEKSLLVLKDGVVEGRKVFVNILKYLKTSASSNFGNTLSVLGASIFLPFLPMAPVQILFNNLLYDISQTAVATDEVEAEDVRRPQRWRIDAIARVMLTLGPVSSVFDYLTFALMWFVLQGAAKPALFQSGWFVESLLSQTLIVHVLRTRAWPGRGHLASAPLRVTTAAIVMVGLWLPASPMAGMLGLVALPAAYWPALMAILLGYMGAAHGVKRLVARRYGWP